MCCTPYSFSTLHKNTSLLPPSESFIMRPSWHFHSPSQIGLPQSVFSKSAPLSSNSIKIIHEHNQDSLRVYNCCFSKKWEAIPCMIRKGMRGNPSQGQEHMEAKWLQDVSPVSIMHLHLKWQHRACVVLTPWRKPTSFYRVWRSHKRRRRILYISNKLCLAW